MDLIKEMVEESGRILQQQMIQLGREFHLVLILDLEFGMKIFWSSNFPVSLTILPDLVQYRSRELGR
jgi:hypothetical protein